MTIRERVLRAIEEECTHPSGSTPLTNIPGLGERCSECMKMADNVLRVMLSLTTDEAVLELRAQVLEYEHALEHAVDPHPVPGAPPHTACPDCQRLCQSALDGVNREGFREIAKEILDDTP